MVAYALIRMLLRKDDPLWTIMHSNRSIRAAAIFSYSSTERMRRKMYRKPREHFKPVSKGDDGDFYINFDGVFG